MKQCPKCKQEKPLSEFNKNNRRVDGLQRICRTCTREADNKSYLKSYQTNSKIRLDRNTETLKRKSEWINSFKVNGCSKCEEKRYHVLDFHHTDPTQKEMHIGSKKGSYKKIEQEIKKCIVLCSNCHRDFHYLERSEDITVEEYLK
jgi:hypothetical protein